MIDPGTFSVGAILVAIFGSIIIFIWQTNSLSGKLESKIETQGKELRAEIETQGRELRKEIETQGKELRAEIETRSNRLEAEIETQGRELRAEIEIRSNRLEAEIKSQGQRLSDSELEQARLNGINSVLTGQTHTHETLAD